MVYEGTLCTSGTGYTNDEDSTSEIHAWDDNGFCKNDATHYQPATNNNGTYEIANAGQLYWFADKVNNGTQIVDAILTKDIVVNKGDVAGCEGTKTEGWREWTPISYYFDQSMGDFDGKGHTISGLYCNDENKDAGLFARAGYIRISNVGVINSYIKGKENAGGITAKNDSYGSIRNCYSICTVSGYDDNAKVGGICGSSSYEIENCYSISNGSVCSANSATIGNCYYLSDSETDDIDGTTAKTAEQFKNGEVCYLLNGGKSDETAAFYQTIGEDDYPVLDSTHKVVYADTDCDGSALNYTNGSDVSQSDHDWDDNGFCKTYPDSHYQPATQNEDGTYEIENAGELYWFAAQVNDGKITDADAVLTADITVNEGNVAGCDGTKTEGWRDWTPIIGIHYMGTFDGQGHVIRGLYFNDTRVGNIGLFSNLNKEGKIQNVGLENSYFRGVAYVGGICAYSNGTIENCYNAGTITAEYDYVGGLVANNFGSIVNCYNTGNITADKDTGGGVAAWNNSGGTIKNCYNSGTLTGGSMNGVVQINDKDGTVENCYYLSDSETDDFDGTTFKTADQFASGEVCYLLNGDQSAIAFYQDLSTEKYPTLNADSEQVCRLEMTYDESFGEDATTVATYHNTGAKITLEKSPDNAYTYHYYVGETEITESPYTLTADTEIIVKKVPVEIQLSEGISDTIELTYHKKMDALDLNDFVTNLDVLESVDFQVGAWQAHGRRA